METFEETFVTRCRQAGKQAGKANQRHKSQQLTCTSLHEEPTCHALLRVRVPVRMPMPVRVRVRVPVPVPVPLPMPNQWSNSLMTSHPGL